MSPARAKPSAPRKIGAENDNKPGEGLAANDDWRAVLDPDPLTRDQLKRLAKAERKMGSPDPQVQAMGRREALQIERQREHRREIIARQRERAETRALEEARGAVIEVSDRPEHKDRLRICTRDGLETLTATRKDRKTGDPLPPALDPIQLAAGLRYRADYEMLDPEKGLTPPAMDSSRSGGHGGDGWAAKRREIELRVVEIERQVQAEDPSHKGRFGKATVDQLGRGVLALREVAGKGQNIMALASSGSGRQAFTKSLAKALDVAAIVYGLE